jgi:alpha-mannosidase
MINPFPALPPGDLKVHAASQGKFLGVEQMPWGQSIRMSSSTINTPEVETEVLLFNDQKRMEFRYRVHKQYTNNKEGAYFAFPVKVSNPDFSYATQQAWINPTHDLMKGGSLEWFNVQQWMAVHDSNLAVGIVPLDASLASFGDINRGAWPGTFTPKTGTIFSYVMNNYWHTNYRAGQGGDFTFRYALTSGSQIDGGSLTRLGLDEMRPAELDYVVRQDKVGDPVRPLPAEGRGLLETDGQDVALITWKLAEDGNGTILRLQETAGKPTDTALHFSHTQIKSAQLCSGVEDDLQNLPVEGNRIPVSLKPFGVVTIRVVAKD